MKFKELLSDPFLQTPKPTIYKNDFLEYVNINLKKFKEKVDSLDEDDDINIPSINYKQHMLKKL